MTGFYSGQIYSGTKTITVTVPAVTHGEAERKIKRIYAVNQVWNIKESNAQGETNYTIFGAVSEGSSSSSGGSVAGAVAGATVGVTGWALKKGWEAISNRPEPGSVASGSYRNYHRRYAEKTGDWSGYEKCVKEEREAGLAVAKWTGIGLGSLVAIALWEVTLPLAIVGGGGYYFYKKNQTKNNPPQVQEKYRKESIK